MPIDAARLNEIVAALPGGPAGNTPPTQRGSVFDEVEFDDLTDDAKCELAKFLIVDCCPTIGAVSTNGDAAIFLNNVASELANWPSQDRIAGRRLAHIVFALSAVAGPSSFTSPLGALAATYLLHQLEFLFRVLSGALTWEGTFVDPGTKALVEQQIGRQNGRINDVVNTYQIMRLNTSVLAPRIYGEIDVQVQKVHGARGSAITNIGERIASLRHPVSHGPLADPSAEGLFYALVLVIALYGSSLFARA